jgi:hypothetical protein
MVDHDLFNFLVPLARREGAWVIEPRSRDFDSDSYLRNLLGRLRLLPARISSPDPKRPYRFAERGEHGKIIIIWVPDE